MAKSFRAAYEAKEIQEDQKPNQNACFAWGCPCTPTITIGNERSCRWHVRKPSDKLQTITHNLRNNIGLVQWHDLLLTMGVVDYLVLKVHHLAPAAYRPQEGEEYLAYKKRIIDLTTSTITGSKQVVEEVVY